MKVFAIASIPQPLTPEQRQQYLPSEVPHTLKLYLEGKIEQFWFREAGGPIFLMNVESVHEAKAVLAAMPIVAGGIATYEVMPVGPLMPLGFLLQGK